MFLQPQYTIYVYIDNDNALTTKGLIILQSILARFLYIIFPFFLSVPLIKILMMNTHEMIKEVTFLIVN